MKKGKWSNEELDFIKHNYEELGPKDVSFKLNRDIVSVKNKAQQLGLKVNEQKPKISKEEMEEAVKNSYSYSDVLDGLYMVRSGGNTKTIKKYIRYYNIDISHFDPHWKNKERIENGGINTKKPISEILKYDSKYNTTKLKYRLYEEGLKERVCELCGQGEEWNGMTISLILDHINGINNDNRWENLRIVCPNCNAGLPTHCKGDKKSRKDKLKEKTKENRENNGGLTDKEIKNKLKQRKVERPSYEQLMKDINELGYLQTGKKYGVSDNAIRKWKKWYENYELK